MNDNTVKLHYMGHLKVLQHGVQTVDTHVDVDLVMLNS